MSEDNVALVSKCMGVLRDHVGIVEAERFIYLIRSEAFDYTKWQREHYDAMTPEEISAEAKRYNSEHPFKGKKAVVI